MITKIRLFYLLAFIFYNMLPTYLFIALILCVFTFQVYLNIRQIKHICKNYANVPSLFIKHIDIEQHQFSSRYNLAKLKLDILNNLACTGMLCLLTLFGGLNYIDSFFSKYVIQSYYLYACLLFFTIFGCKSLISVLFAYIRQFKIETRFGFNTMTLKLFFADLFKQAFIVVLFLVPLLMCFLWLIQKPYGWLILWCIWILFNIILLWVYPKYISPLFNTFKELKSLDFPRYEKLFTDIHALFAKAKFNVTDILVMDGSKRSKHGNAYFTGIGRNKRIVFFDTLLNSMSHAQILAVLAHELGHLAHKHIVKRITNACAFSLLFFYMLNVLVNYYPFYQFMGVMPHIFGQNISYGNHALLLVLLFLILPYVTYIFMPWLSYISRKHEFEADAFAVKYTNVHDLNAALIKLYINNASIFTQDKLYAMFYYTHPPINERIEAIYK